jgi:hypothetical protein
VLDEGEVLEGGGMMGLEAGHCEKGEHHKKSHKVGQEYEEMVPRGGPM